MSNTMIALLAVLDDIAASLRTLAASAPQTTPDYQRRLEEFAGFDWQAIGATVLENDQDGPAAVEWRGRRYTRRAPQNKFDAAIWFSRASGRDEDGTVHYERLITFKVQAEPEPLPAKAKQALAAFAPAPAQNGNGHKTAPVSAPAPTAQSEAPKRITRTSPLGPDALRVWLNAEAEALAAKGKGASQTQTGAVHQALVKVIPDETLRRNVQVFLAGVDSMAAMSASMVLALHSWLKPAPGNGLTDAWAKDEIDLVIDHLRPTGDHPAWETSADAQAWAARMGAFVDEEAAKIAFQEQWAAWGHPVKAEMFRRWEEHIDALLMETPA